MECEDAATASESDGLDIVINLAGRESPGSETGTSTSKKRKRPGTPTADTKTKGTRVEWSESDDDHPASFATKKRSRKPAALDAPRREPKAPKSNTTSIVGKKAAPKKSKGRAFMPRNILDVESDFEDQLADEDLPDYIKERRVRFDKNRNRLGEAGLKLPPRYDDVEFSDDDRMQDLKERPQMPNLKPCAAYEDKLMETSGGIIPASIAQWLRSYQVEGATFLHEKFVYQQGGLLGDDMGLGKTIQVIAFLTAAFGKTGDERDRKRMRKFRRATGRWYPRVMIVCPKGLVTNWHQELQRWGWWQIYICHGSEASRIEAIRAAENGRLEIMISTYDTYKRNVSAINSIDWDCVIADEVHGIKGRHSDITRCMNEVNAMCRLGLTGTAIQNNYEELWVLLNWANPGQLGNLKSWKKCISEPLKLGQAYDCTTHQLGTARKTAKTLVERLLPRYFLRRMKSLIADQLPKKKDRVVFCPLTDSQADAYERLVDSEVFERIRTSGDPCACASGKQYGWCCGALLDDGSKWQHHVFPSIVTLQKLCNHLALLIPSTADSNEKVNKDVETLAIAMPDKWRDLYRNRDSILNYSNVDFCGKWKVLKSLLEYWYGHPSPEGGRNKVLVFSHSVRLLKMLSILFTTKTTYNVSYLDGSMTMEGRQDVLDDFNANETQFVFLISTKAGGTGLNITSANKVVVFDPNWNPAHDLQAQDRAYRIGQLRDVEVFRLISAGTIDEIVYARQIYKQQQANIGYNASLERRYFRGVQDFKEKKGEIFGLINLLAYQGDHVVLREIVNKSNVAESRAGVLVTDIETQDYDEAENGDDDVLRGKDEDTQEKALSQLAALITGEEDEKKLARKRKKTEKDPVQAILAGAGVSYTHENSEVIGTSRVESKLSRRAVERENDIDALDEFVFDQGPSERDAGGLASGDGAEGVEWRYRPPEDVRMRQFCSMATHFGFADATEFALVVESWSQSQRRACLDKFYGSRREALKPTVPRGKDDDTENEEL